MQLRYFVPLFCVEIALPMVLASADSLCTPSLFSPVYVGHTHPVHLQVLFEWEPQRDQSGPKRHCRRYVRAYHGVDQPLRLVPWDSNSKLSQSSWPESGRGALLDTRTCICMDTDLLYGVGAITGPPLSLVWWWCCGHVGSPLGPSQVRQPECCLFICLSGHGDPSPITRNTSLVT